jgi:ankyrin repeat protein
MSTDSEIKVIIEKQTRSITDLLNYRKRDSQYQRVVDKQVYDTWAKILTQPVVKQYLEDGDEYVGQQILDTRNYLKAMSRKDVSAKFGDTAPHLYLFWPKMFFIRNLAPKSDELFIKNGLIDEQFVSEDARGQIYHTALYVACFVGNFERVHFLLDSGASVNLDNTNFQSQPIYAAVTRTINNSSQMFHQQHIIRLLIAHDAILDRISPEGKNLLMICEAYAYRPLLETKRCAINHQDNDGITFLMKLCKEDEDWSDTITLAIKNGADPNLIDKDHSTALIHACQITDGEGQDIKIDALLKGGANPNILDEEDNLPLMIFLGYNETHDPKPDDNDDDRMHAESIIDSIETIIKAFIDAGTNMEFEHEEYGSIFTHLTEPRLIRFVYDYGGREKLLPAINTFINEENGENNNPLLKAFRKKHFDTMVVLLELGANPVQEYKGEQLIVRICRMGEDIDEEFNLQLYAILNEMLMYTELLTGPNNQLKDILENVSNNPRLSRLVNKRIKQLGISL